MKNIRDIVLIAAVVIGLLLLVVFLFRRDKAAADATQQPGQSPGGDPPRVPFPCQNIPDHLPRFQTASTPSAAKTFLGVPDADWTADVEARLRGFFLALDVEPSDFTMKYFGAPLIWQYLNSPEGQLSDLLVLKGVKRCGAIVQTPSTDLPKPPFCINPSVRFDDKWSFDWYFDAAGTRQAYAFEDTELDQYQWDIKNHWGYSDLYPYSEGLAARILGFFKAANLKPDWGVNFAASKSRPPELGGERIITAYLNSGYGGLPHQLVQQGSMRCDTATKFIQYL